MLTVVTQRVEGQAIAMGYTASEGIETVTPETSMGPDEANRSSPNGRQANVLVGAKWTLPVLVLAGAALYYFSYIRYGISFNDEGLLLMGADGILKGKVLYRDLFVAYMPGGYYLYALFLKAFGSSIVVARMLGLVLRLCSVALCIALARRVLPAVLTILPAIPMILVPGPWHKALFVTLSLLNMATAVWYSDDPTTRRLTVCGIVAGLTALYRHELGLVAIGTIAVAILVSEAFTERADRRPITTAIGPALFRIILLVIVAIVAMAPMLIYLYTQNALRDMLGRVLFGPLRYNLAISKGFPSLVGLPALTRLRDVLRTVSYDLYVLLYYLPLAVYAATLGLVGNRLLRQRLDSESRDALIVCVSGILVYGIVYIRPAPAHLLVAVPPAYLAATYLGHRLIKAPRGQIHQHGRWWRIASVALIVLCLVGGLLWLVTSWRDPYFVGAINLRWSNPAYLDLPRAGVYGQNTEVQNTKRTITYIRAHSRPGDTLLVMPTYDWLFYFLCQCFPPSKQPIQFSADERRYTQEQQLVQDLVARRTPYIILIRGKMAQNPVLSSPDSKVMAYVQASYHEERRFGKYVILRLNAD